MSGLPAPGRVEDRLGVGEDAHDLTITPDHESVPAHHRTLPDSRKVGFVRNQRIRWSKQLDDRTPQRLGLTPPVQDLRFTIPSR